MRGCWISSTTIWPIKMIRKPRGVTKVVTKMPLNGSPVVNSFRKINWKKALTGAAIGSVAAGPVGTFIGQFYRV